MTLAKVTSTLYKTRNDEITIHYNGMYDSSVLVINKPYSRRTMATDWTVDDLYRLAEQLLIAARQMKNASRID